MSNIVQERMGKTFGYFGYGILSTSAFVYYMRNSMAWASVHPLLLFGGSVALMYGAHAMPYDTQYLPKMMLYTAFTGCMGLSILPLIQVSAAAAVADAALATGLSMTALGAVAYNAPSEQFLNWAGPLSFACMGMMGISVLSMFRPQSRALFNIWLYGGLVLSGGLTMFRTQAMMRSAKTEMYYDPINHSMGFYMDAINFFVRFLMIFGGNKRK